MILFDILESIIHRSYTDSNTFYAYNLIFFLSTFQLKSTGGISTLTAGQTNTLTQWKTVCATPTTCTWCETVSVWVCVFNCVSQCEIQMNHWWGKDLQHVQRWLVCHQREWPRTGERCLSVWRTPFRRGCWSSAPWSLQKPVPGGYGVWRGQSGPHWIHAGDPLCHGVCSSFWQSLAMLLSKRPAIKVAY